jgi:hypothetical protein
VRAEAGGHEEPSDLRLPQAELVVGRKGLGSIDHASGLHVLELRHAPARVHGDLLEAVPVRLEQAPVEVRRDRVEAGPAARQEGRRRAALVAAHQQPAALLAEVDRQVGVAQRGERVPLVALPEGPGNDVLVRHRLDRDPHTRQAPELGREHSGGDHHHLALDVAALGPDAPHPPALALDPGHARGGEDARAARPRPLGELARQLRRIDVAVAWKEGSADHALRRHERKQLLRLLRRDQLQGQAEGLGRARLAPQLLHPLPARGESDPAALDPAWDRPVQLDRAHHHPGQRDVAAQLAHQGGRVEGRARGELVSLQEHHAVPAGLDQVVGDRRPPDAASHDHAAGGAGELKFGHGPP